MAKNNAKPKSNLIDGWEVVIGIEIHTQLATKSKIFSGSSTVFGNDPNTQASLAINAPVGFDHNNLPVGLQLIGNYWSESQLLSVV
ncbi:hypothetical protein EKL28_17025, partial [Staphylococcus aureus]